MSPAPPRVQRLLGAAFTSEEEVEGWRHFHVVSVQRVEGAWQVELAASCEGRRRVWVPAKQLLAGEGWRPGWIPRRAL